MVLNKSVVKKYMIQGLVIALVAYYVPIKFKTSLRKPNLMEVFGISVTAAMTMFILDSFTIEKHTVQL